jgi:hypothetical protein
MKRLLLILTLCLPLSAAEILFTAPGSFSITDVTHSHAYACWTGDVSGTVATNRKVVWDTKTYFDLNDAYRYNTGTSATRITSQCQNITGLTPGTTYTACPDVTDASANASDCTAATGNAASRIEFTTLAEPAAHPQPPTPPDLSGFDTSMPTVFEPDLNVAANCSDFQTQLNAAASATYNNLNVRVVIPNTTTCSATNWNLPLKTGTGWVVVTSSTHAKLPPEGVRVSPNFDSQMPIIEGTDTNGFFSVPTPGDVRIRFVGIEFRPNYTATDADPTFMTYFMRMDGGANYLIFDRCWWNGRGHPYRIQRVWYGEGDYVAFLNNYIEKMDIWRAYKSGLAVTHSPDTKNSYASGTVYFGAVNQSVSAFDITLSGDAAHDGTFELYVDIDDGSVHFVHDIAAMTPTCNGVTCSYNASPSVPSDGLALVHPNDDEIENGKFLNGAEATGDIFEGSGTYQYYIPADTSAYAEGNNGIIFEDTSRYIIIDNNYIQITGISLFLGPGAGDDIQDVQITRNTFDTTATWYAPTSGDTNGVALRRQYFECKQCERVLVNGNLFLGSYTAVGGNLGPTIQIKSDATTATALTADISIRNNKATDQASCFYLMAAQSAVAVKETYLARRIEISNNVCTADGHDRRQFFIPAGTSSTRGFSIVVDMGGEDYIFRHNTFYDMRGSGPRFLVHYDKPAEGLVADDNIFLYHDDSGNGGVEDGTNWYSSHLPTFGGAEGTAVLDGVWRQVTVADHSFADNVVVAACSDSSTATCIDETTTSLVDRVAKAAI